MRRHKIVKVTAIFCLMLLPVKVQAASSAVLVKKGNAAYDAGNYDDALKAYEQAGVDNPESAPIYYNKGAAYYRKGDFGKAKEAWEKAALDAKDIPLQARSLFNLGNCAFAEATRQQDSDPKKAMAAFARSIKYYQQMLDLIKNPADSQEGGLKKDASENIEIIRLVMKSILDSMQKQREQARQQQKTVKKLKQLIARQQELNDRNRYYNDEKQNKGESQALKDNISRMARDQRDLREKTQEVAKNIPSSGQQKAKAAEKARRHLRQARVRQKAAADHMDAGRLSDSQKDQERALDEMKQALDSLDRQNSPKNPGKRQNQNNSKKQSASADRRNTQKPSEKKQPATASNTRQQQNRQDQNTENARMPDDAQRILDEEKENQKNRRPLSVGGYRNIDKDW